MVVNLNQYAWDKRLWRELVESVYIQLHRAQAAIILSVLPRENILERCYDFHLSFAYASVWLSKRENRILHRSKEYKQMIKYLTGTPAISAFTKQFRYEYVGGCNLPEEVETLITKLSRSESVKQEDVVVAKAA